MIETKIINTKIFKDIEQGKEIRLHLGSGKNILEGFYNLDSVEIEGTDIVADLNQPLDFLPDNCIYYIYTHHCLEHIENFLPLMREIHRIVNPLGVIEIVVPHFSNVYGFSDPTHVRFFGLYTMFYFTNPQSQPFKRKLPEFYSDTRFIVSSVNIEFYNQGFWDKFFLSVLKWVNMNIYTQDFYERRISSFLHARQIRYVIRPDKT